MKEYEGKNLDEVLAKASEELNLPIEKLNYKVLSEVKTLFKKYCKISVLTIDDAPDYACQYLENILSALELNAEVSSIVKEGIIHVNMISENDASKIIGRGGETLQALNELVRTAVYNKFDQHISLIVNINNYKDQKYDKLTRLAKRLAYSVKKTKMTIELDPMPSDERRIIHNALANDERIQTISVGAGKSRHITIQYVNIQSKEDKPKNEEGKTDTNQDKE